MRKKEEEEIADELLLRLQDMSAVVSVKKLEEDQYEVLAVLSKPLSWLTKPAEVTTEN